MDQVRAVCSTASSLRKAERLRVRLPLSELTVVTKDPAGLEPYAAIIADELNVKKVSVVDAGTVDEADFGIVQRLVVNARAAGPRLGRDVQAVIRASKSGDWSVDDDGAVHVAGIRLEPGEFELEQAHAEGRLQHHATAALPGGGGLVALDTEVSPELEVEGAARDLVRAVQQARRDAGLEVSDRISLEVAGAEFVHRAVTDHRDLVAGETLAEQLSVAPDLDALAVGDGVAEVVVGEGHRARIRVTRR
jgi:isoleucyl-tRNA synthetase